MPSVIDSRPPAPLRYAKHANSLKDIKPTANKMAALMDTDQSIRSKLLSNSSSSRIATAAAAATSGDNSVNFTRPLKTSTAVCLSDLRGRMANETPPTSSAAFKQPRTNYVSKV